MDEFCARRGINRRTFNWWRWKLASTPVAEPVAGAPTRLVAVEVRAASERREASIEIVVDGPALVIRLHEAAPVYVAELVGQLRTRC